jgi:hypothetical protein
VQGTEDAWQLIQDAFDGEEENRYHACAGEDGENGSVAHRS